MYRSGGALDPYSALILATKHAVVVLDSQALRGLLSARENAEAD
jgi:hypothetical protein